MGARRVRAPGPGNRKRNGRRPEAAARIVPVGKFRQLFAGVCYSAMIQPAALGLAG